MQRETILDRLTETFSRRVAQRSSRRSVLARLGVALVGGALLPILPVDRSGRFRKAHAQAFFENAQADDNTQCNYWRYCAMDGYLCTCCGGGITACPAGSEPSPTSWVGSCINPEDGQTYLIAYRDCCGKGVCGQCPCLSTEGEMPVYRPQLSNDIDWCFGARSMVYHCTGAGLVGKA
jgi:methylamine dehydrogenase light chain